MIIVAAVFVPCSARHGKFCSRAHANMVATYRDERRRQELLWEAKTGGYAGDDQLLRAQGERMISLRDWLGAA